VSINYPGFVIDQILERGDSKTLITKDSELHDPQYFIQGETDLVGSYIIQGDTSGDDQPFAFILFNPVRLRLRSLETGEILEDVFDLPKPPLNNSYQIFGVPSLIKGDAEFNGHGPRIKISTQVTASGSILQPSAGMSFEETEEDSTTFVGNFNGLPLDVSQRYPGYVIDAILSDSTDDFETIDVELHDSQRITLDSNELVSSYDIEGDIKGDDKPSVTLTFNPIRVRLRPI
jgi:hypothetical protein